MNQFVDITIACATNLNFIHGIIHCFFIPIDSIFKEYTRVYAYVDEMLYIQKLRDSQR